MYQINDSIIEADIKVFEARIRSAKRRLEALPTGRIPYAQHKKRERQRQELQNEINHVLRLIGYAQEALKT